MNLDLPEEQTMLVDTFRRFFADESSMERVRAAEPLGFDPALHRALGELGALGLRTSATGLGVLDAMLVCEEAGRMLATTPLAETIVALRLLEQFGADDGLLTACGAGDAVVTLALHEAQAGISQIVPAGAVANYILYLSGEDVVLVKRDPQGTAPLALSAIAVEQVDLLAAAGERQVLQSGAGAKAAFLGAIDEWKLLTAAILIGLSRQALQLAVGYASEREQFGRIIGSYQAIAHPLADRACDIDGGGLLNWWAASRVAKREADAGAATSMAFWWAAQTAGETAARALHTFGGYGLTTEYDVQLYHRRAYALGILLGDPARELLRVADRLWMGEQAPLYDAGEVPLDFDIGADAQELVAETQRHFDRLITPEIRAKAHFSYDGYNEDVDRALAEVGLLFPSWPVEWGGRGASLEAASASLKVWSDYDHSAHAQSVSNMVGKTVIEFGSEELKRKVVPEIAAGRALCALGYSEPGNGSDIFAARSRAVRDGDDWIINGQKMFTSGGHLADYILMITRTDPDAPKHKGITLFLVPVKQVEGFECHRIDTFQDEPTNATFYTDVRIPDFYRVGEVNGGVKVLSAALVLEQQGGYGYGNRVMAATLNWAKGELPDGRRPIEEPDTRRRIARMAVHSRVSECLGVRSMWAGRLGMQGPRNAFGPMSKLFSSEAYQRDAADMLQLTAPFSLLRGRDGLGIVEQFHRQSAVGTIYAGTSEIQRSQIAEVHLGLPRSRS